MVQYTQIHCLLSWGAVCSNTSGSFPPPTLNHFSLLTCIYNFAAFASHFYQKTEVTQDDKCVHKCHVSVKLGFSNRFSKTNLKKVNYKSFPSASGFQNSQAASWLSNWFVLIRHNLKSNKHLYSTGSSSRRNGTQWHSEGAHRQKCLCPCATARTGHTTASLISWTLTPHCYPALAEQHSAAPRARSLITDSPSTRGSHTTPRASLELHKRKFANNEGRDVSPSITTTELKAQLKTSLKPALNPNTLHKYQAQCAVWSSRPARGRGSSRTSTGAAAQPGQEQPLGHGHPLIPPRAALGFKSFHCQFPGWNPNCLATMILCVPEILLSILLLTLGCARRGNATLGSIWGKRKGKSTG